MTKKAVSWVLVGAFAYIWWWLGHRWQFLNVSGSQRGEVYVLFTLISLAVMTRTTSVAGSGMFNGLVGAIRGFLPNLLWLALAIVCVHLVALVHTGVVYSADLYVRALVNVLLAGFTTSLWYGAIVNATGDS